MFNFTNLIKKVEGINAEKDKIMNRFQFEEGVTRKVAKSRADRVIGDLKKSDKPTLADLDEAVRRMGAKAPIMSTEGFPDPVATIQQYDREEKDVFRAFGTLNRGDILSGSQVDVHWIRYSAYVPLGMYAYKLIHKINYEDWFNFVRHYLNAEINKIDRIDFENYYDSNPYIFLIEKNFKLAVAMNFLMGRPLCFIAGKEMRDKYFESEEANIHSEDWLKLPSAERIEVTDDNITYRNIYPSAATRPITVFDYRLTKDFEYEFSGLGPDEFKAVKRTKTWKATRLKKEEFPSTYTPWNRFNDQLRNMFAQHHCCEPHLRLPDTMILDPDDWDNSPEPYYNVKVRDIKLKSQTHEPDDL